MLLIVTLAAILPPVFSFDCYGFDDVGIRYIDPSTSSTISDPSRFSIANNTRHCHDLHKSVAPSTEPSRCHPSVATLHVGTIRVIPERVNVLPHVTMNISVDVHDPVEQVVLRMECLSASDLEDQYCHNPKALMRLGDVTLQPCRALDLRGSAPKLPFRFAYSCFRMYGFSQYRVNATLLPINCRLSLIVAIPSVGEIYPEILNVYKNTHPTPTSSAEWAPLVAVDTDEVDGVWLRFAPPERYAWSVIRLAVAERNPDTRLLSIVKEFTVPYPNTGVKWTNAPPGEYTVYAHVPRHDCSFLCDRGHPGCRVCVHTPLNFTLADHKAGIPWRTIRAVGDAGLYIITFLLVMLVAVCVVGGAVLTYLRRRALKNPRAVELTERPTVLFVFADDCQEHNDVVLQLANSIGRLANARVLIDQDELVRTGVKPSRWLVETLSSSSRILIVLSPAVPFVLSGRSLIQRRPFPDHFNSALDMIINEVSVQQRRERFAVLRLPYSPPTPQQIKLLNIRTFEVPAEVVLLTTFLHGMESARAISHPFECEERRAIEEAVARFQYMSRKEPAWLLCRLMEKVVAPQKAVDLSDVPVENAKEINAEDQLKKALALGLLEPPDSDEDDRDDARFQLLEPPDSDSE